MANAAEVSICIDETKLEMDSGSGKVFGPIHIVIGETYFPDREWTDFLVTAMKTWASQIGGLLANRTGLAECHFMDGPYWFEVGRETLNLWRVTCFERSTLDPRRQVSVAIVEPTTLLAQLSHAITRVHAVCERMDWKTADTENLAKALIAIQQ